jgi:hypothetical protein
MQPNDDPKLDAERRRAQRLLRWIIGAVILFNLVLLLWLFLPK